jgi:hypothetical protein
MANYFLDGVVFALGLNCSLELDFEFGFVSLFLLHNLHRQLEAQIYKKGTNYVSQAMALYKGYGRYAFMAFLLNLHGHLRIHLCIHFIPCFGHPLLPLLGLPAGHPYLQFSCLCILQTLIKLYSFLSLVIQLQFLKQEEPHIY